MPAFDATHAGSDETGGQEGLGAQRDQATIETQEPHLFREGGRASGVGGYGGRRFDVGTAQSNQADDLR